MKRFLVNSAIVAILALIGWYCFVNGKAYSVILENMPCSVEGKAIPALEAVNVILDGKAPAVYLLEGDRVVCTVIGKKHEMRIDILDMNDVAIPGKSRVFKFTVDDLGENPSLSVPIAYEKSQPVDK